MPLGINGEQETRPNPFGSKSRGYSWSSAVSRTYCVFLGFGTQYLNPCSTDNRAFGRQLRCLSE
ncbi:hypothetical protein [uncultured Rikenella sp.]|uniref:hypothetical protein n=1 Tax=uncultured Rikenella sp. TaxID=368003 RepID=UPI0025CF4F3D|nr:hypothetical protein [uncultured Rikenella sp.]